MCTLIYIYNYMVYTFGCEDCGLISCIRIW